MSQKIQFNTFGGNPVCSAGGLAVLNVIDKEKRQEHCADVGSHLVERLKALQQKHESNSFCSFAFLLEISPYIPYMLITLLDNTFCFLPFFLLIQL